MPKPLGIVGINLWLSAFAIDEMLLERKRTFALETGGILLGYRCIQGTCEHWVVTKVVGPGENAAHHGRSFLPDCDYHEQKAIEHFDETNGDEYYLGDWHTHPNSSSYTSWRDKITIYRNARRATHTEQRSLMVIIGGPLENPQFFGHIGNTLDVYLGLFAKPATVISSKFYGDWLQLF
ncbi:MULTISPECIES: Mov34/MPN/PAD-1 family protein [Idiomarina]|jgi:integrative and conjugative element protein (TIGR02256 family)|uniref:Mov34/MPN/PAD-1 family protein n=1 Tax=Idiomarina TaxID=135575 RepID=UPI000C096A8D|nr:MULTISPECIES: Mov34/MPN/PAD-1 family protein [Idiomarina]MAC33239.1 hypothetical protein [Haliea sp.]MBF79666.1 hypothetical protein [Idiomarina sp.]|tara:strand:- start:1237 stop:1773 length:537 start_codon:yes stop_codon:yes gene_type:complete